MGLGLLSMPYAMRLSGWLGIPALAALTCLFCLSGKLIVHAFDKMPLHRPHTYPALGEPCTAFIAHTGPQTQLLYPQADRS